MSHHATFWGAAAAVAVVSLVVGVPVVCAWLDRSTD